MVERGWMVGVSARVFEEREEKSNMSDINSSIVQHTAHILGLHYTAHVAISVLDCYAFAGAAMAGVAGGVLVAHGPAAPSLLMLAVGVAIVGGATTLSRVATRATARFARNLSRIGWPDLAGTSNERLIDLATGDQDAFDAAVSAEADRLRIAKATKHE